MSNVLDMRVINDNKNKSKICEKDGHPCFMHFLENKRSEMIELNEKNFVEEIDQRCGLVLVDFWAPWCIPCKLLEPTLVMLENDIYIGKVNIDKNIELAKKFYIRSVPTLLIFSNGEIVQRYIGVQHVSTIKGFITSFEKHKDN